jgi:hypothetical protein
MFPKEINKAYNYFKFINVYPHPSLSHWERVENFLARSERIEVRDIREKQVVIFFRHPRSFHA